MTDGILIPTEDFFVPGLDEEEGQKLTSGGVAVRPHVSIKGTTVTIRLSISIPVLGEDTKTLVLTKANKWADKAQFFGGLKKFDVNITAETATRRIHVQFSKKTIVKDFVYDHYFPYANFTLPTDFQQWTKSDPKHLATLKQLYRDSRPVEPKHRIQLEPDEQGPRDACALLGAPGFPDGAGRALTDMAPKAGPLTASGRDAALFALGILDDASIFTGGMLGTGFWWTNTGRCGWYSTLGGQIGSFVGVAAHIVYTLVWATGDQDAVQNFSDFHLSRGIAGEGLSLSFGLLGDVKEQDIYGILIGGGLNLGTPAAGFIGAGHQFMVDF